MTSTTPGSKDRAQPDEQRANQTHTLLFGGLALLFVLFAVVILLTDAFFLIPLGILAVIVFGFLGVNRLLAKRIIDRDGSLDAALSDNEDPIPSVHMSGGDAAELGDTAEAHDEITPHDLPLFHPGRAEAVAQAGGVDGEVTTGNEDPSDTAAQSARPVAASPQKGSSSKRRRAHE